MDVEFVTRADGIIEARVSDNHGLLNHALEDSVSSRAPRGAPTGGLSTYWIDRAAEGVRAAMESASTAPFLSGNVTYLRLECDRVVAGYDFDPDEEDADSIDVQDFLSLLARWRRVVTEAGGASGSEAEPHVKPRPMGPTST